MSKLEKYQDYRLLMEDMLTRTKEANEIKVRREGPPRDSATIITVTMTRNETTGRYGSMSYLHREFMPQAIEMLMPLILIKVEVLAADELEKLKREARAEVLEFIENEMEGR